MKSNTNKKGILYSVAIDIGNRADITSRAIELIRHADFIVGEEPRDTAKLLKQFSVEKTTFFLNEHNRAETGCIIAELEKGRMGVLVSDCGTPLFSDPGHELIADALAAGIMVSPVPGASSLSAILSVCPFDMSGFVFTGFPPRTNEPRKNFFYHLGRERRPVILMDAPYRFIKVINELKKSISANRRILLGINLTQKGETILFDTIGNVSKKFHNQKRKCEFIIVIEAVVDRKSNYKK